MLCLLRRRDCWQTHSVLTAHFGKKSRLRKRAWAGDVRRSLFTSFMNAVAPNPTVRTLASLP